MYIYKNAHQLHVAGTREYWINIFVFTDKTVSPSPHNQSSPTHLIDDEVSSRVACGKWHGKNNKAGMDNHHSVDSGLQNLCRERETSIDYTTSTVWNLC